MGHDDQQHSNHGAFNEQFNVEMMTQATHVGDNRQKREEAKKKLVTDKCRQEKRRSNRSEPIHGDGTLERIRQGELFVVNSRRRNGLILFKKYHAEFAGPGAAVGSFLDLDCQSIYAVGSLSLIEPQSHDERQRAYLIRRQWIRLTYQFTDNEAPIKRAQKILNQFENYFDRETIARVPDDAFALMVGVLPHTVRLARRPPRKHSVRVMA
ncbi:MAG: hypothetical protein AAGA75_16795 [Cyanobacteria bacterium P01_E01_bin.6]